VKGVLNRMDTKKRHATGREETRIFSTKDVGMNREFPRRLCLRLRKPKETRANARDCG